MYRCQYRCQNRDRYRYLGRLRDCATAFLDCLEVLSTFTAIEIQIPCILVVFCFLFRSALDIYSHPASDPVHFGSLSTDPSSWHRKRKHVPLPRRSSNFWRARACRLLQEASKLFNRKLARKQLRAYRMHVPTPWKQWTEEEQHFARYEAKSDSSIWPVLWSTLPVVALFFQHHLPLLVALVVLVAVTGTWR